MLDAHIYLNIFWENSNPYLEKNTGYGKNWRNDPDGLALRVPLEVFVISLTDISANDIIDISDDDISGRRGLDWQRGKLQ